MYLHARAVALIRDGPCCRGTASQSQMPAFEAHAKLKGIAMADSPARILNLVDRN